MSHAKRRDVSDGDLTGSVVGAPDGRISGFASASAGLSRSCRRPGRRDEERRGQAAAGAAFLDAGDDGGIDAFAPRVPDAEFAALHALHAVPL